MGGKREREGERERETEERSQTRDTGKERNPVGGLVCSWCLERVKLESHAG